MKVTKETLKHCPFCGHRGSHGGDFELQTVGCSNVLCCLYGLIRVTGGHTQEARDEWNTRVPRKPSILDQLLHRSNI